MNHAANHCDEDHGGFVDYYTNVTGQKYINIWMGKAGTGRS